MKKCLLESSFSLFLFFPPNNRIIDIRSSAFSLYLCLSVSVRIYLPLCSFLSFSACRSLYVYLYIYFSACRSLYVCLYISFYVFHSSFSVCVSFPSLAHTNTHTRTQHKLLSIKTNQSKNNSQICATV